jgi:hypothetical protein
MQKRQTKKQKKELPHFFAVFAPFALKNFHFDATLSKNIVIPTQAGI